jgi:hypothetical protein
MNFLNGVYHVNWYSSRSCVKRGNKSQLCVTITQLYLVRFEVFTATSINVPVFSDVQYRLNDVSEGKR